MRSSFLLIVIFSLGSANAFSQIAQKRNMQKAKPDTLLKAKIVDTTLYNKSIIKTSPVGHTAQETSVVPKSNNNMAIGVKKENIASTGQSNMLPPKVSASLFDIFILVKTGTEPGIGPLISTGDNKDHDTHWSCGVFDQNEKQIGSFHDDSDNDDYPMGSTTGPLKMHLDNSATLSNFVRGGHLHINIAPVGNDTWGISEFTLTFDFVTPDGTEKVTWPAFSLSQDHRDVDFYFTYDGQNFVPRK